MTEMSNVTGLVSIARTFWELRLSGNGAHFVNLLSPQPSPDLTRNYAETARSNLDWRALALTQDYHRQVHYISIDLVSGFNDNRSVFSVAEEIALKK